MGVRKLSAFHDAQCLPKQIDMRMEIEKAKGWRGEIPILVFDTQGLMALMPFDEPETRRYDNVYGGRGWVCIESLERLFTELTECGTELVFFFDGSHSVDDAQRKMKENNEKYKKRLILLQSIRAGNETAETVQDQNAFGINFAYNRTLISVIKGVCEKFGKAIMCEKYECDREIVSYVMKNPRVLGIVSSDSDFMIFPGNFRCFSTASIVYRQKPKILSIVEYQRGELRRKLQLNDLQLAVFATFRGNGFVSYDLISPFHNKVPKEVRKGGYQNFYDIADWVRKMIPESKTILNELWLKFKIMLTDLAGTDEELLKIVDGQLQENFIKSIEFYMCNQNLQLSCDAAPEAFEDHLTYKVLNNMVKTKTPKLHDMHDNSMGKFEDLFHSRLRRQYGAILHLHSVERKLIFCSQLSHQNECRMIELDPEYPPFDVQHFNKNSPENQRLKLLKWLSHLENAEDFNIDTFPNEFVADILTMCCMFTNKAIKLKELDLLLWTVFACHQRIIPRSLEVNIDEVIHYRTLCIPHSFTSIRNEVLDSIDICKFREKFWKPNSFDGVFFNQEYRKYKCDFQPDQQLEVKSDRAEQFNEIRDKLHSMLEIL